MSWSEMEHVPFVARYGGALRLPALHIQAAYLDPGFPCRPLPRFPFHVALGACEPHFEPAFIQRRNERERHRVRCVNEGYARLREHLPRELDERRLSKVETLRAAIDYIKHLQRLLEPGGAGRERPEGRAGEAREARARRGHDGDMRH
ncbi:achaete-scute homolog 4-like [Kryptolebias marmoratus]|uniref:achaete-scute homolog 4-like n=1 Tax=Kryptolebias marmoratus TaxID=37003 RepID=UPI0007F8CEC9|nr:achaete-scute homolog 4-like [Kryptolebias marmoratus]